MSGLSEQDREELGDVPAEQVAALAGRYEAAAEALYPGGVSNLAKRAVYLRVRDDLRALIVAQPAPTPERALVERIETLADEWERQANLPGTLGDRPIRVAYARRAQDLRAALVPSPDAEPVGTPEPDLAERLRTLVDEWDYLDAGYDAASARLRRERNAALRALLTPAPEPVGTEVAAAAAQPSHLHHTWPCPGFYIGNYDQMRIGTWECTCTPAPADEMSER